MNILSNEQVAVLRLLKKLHTYPVYETIQKDFGSRNLLEFCGDYFCYDILCAMFPNLVFDSENDPDFDCDFDCDCSYLVEFAGPIFEELETLCHQYEQQVDIERNPLFNDLFEDIRTQLCQHCQYFSCVWHFSTKEHPYCSINIHYYEGVYIDMEFMSFWTDIYCTIADTVELLRSTITENAGKIIPFPAKIPLEVAA